MSLEYKFKKRVNPSKDPIFTITIYGEMVIQTAEKIVNKPYEHTYRVPKSVVDERGPISPFKNAIAKAQFPILYPGFQSLATHHIKQVVCEEQPELVIANPILCNFEQLMEIVEDTDGDVDPTLYTDEDQLRQALLDYINDPEIFAIQQDRIKAMRGQHAAVVANVLRLNPLPLSPASDVAVSNSPVLAASTPNKQEEPKLVNSSEVGFFGEVPAVEDFMPSDETVSAPVEDKPKSKAKAKSEEV